MRQLIKMYYRLTKPGIIYGNLLTTTGGFLLAAQGSIAIGVLMATLAGTTLIIASGCVFNNYLDRELDKKMARTQKRALASGKVPIRNALVYGSTLGLLGLGTLILGTNTLVVGMGLLAWIFYVIVYGFAKRHSVHGTLVGTIPGSAPPVAGYLAVSQHFDAGVFLLFIIMVCWQMAHFYAIALYRLRDYQTAGLPVWPARRGTSSTQRQILVWILGFIGANLALYLSGYVGFIYLAVLLPLSLHWLWLGVRNREQIDSKSWGRKMFLFSLIIITALSGMLAVNTWTKDALSYAWEILLAAHAITALASLLYITHLFVSPLKSRFSTAYGLAALSLITGIGLILADGGTHMLQACSTGLLYISLVSILIFAARRKLANSSAH